MRRLVRIVWWAKVLALNHKVRLITVFKSVLCFIDLHVTITGEAKLGDRGMFDANTVIGGEGFGFAPYQGKSASYCSIRFWNYISGNDVRIGFNCSIDRGALDDTILEDGVIIDNLVQIAHNVLNSWCNMGTGGQMWHCR